MTTLPPDVATITSDLLDGIRAVLGADLVALYLRGSLAMGDFDPITSDVDFFAVTERPVTPDQFAALAALHRTLGASPTPYGNKLEGSYINRGAAWRFVPGQQHPTIAYGEALVWTPHDTNWVLERFMVREHGLTIFGPDPNMLIDALTPAELRAATRARLPAWVAFANDAAALDWSAPRSEKAYMIETMCRAIYTLTTGDLASKPVAITWAIAHLPEPWRSLAVRSRAWHADATDDLSSNNEIATFIRWTAAVAERGHL